LTLPFTPKLKVTTTLGFLDVPASGVKFITIFQKFQSLLPTISAASKSQSLLGPPYTDSAKRCKVTSKE